MSHLRVTREAVKAADSAWQEARKAALQAKKAEHRARDAATLIRAMADTTVIDWDVVDQEWDV